MNRPISLLPNLNKNNGTESIDNKENILNDNEDQEIPPAIEDVIEHLIQGLRDKAITIRYANKNNKNNCIIRFYFISNSNDNNYYLLSIDGPLQKVSVE